MSSSSGSTNLISFVDKLSDIEVKCFLQKQTTIKNLFLSDNEEIVNNYYKTKKERMLTNGGIIHPFFNKLIISDDIEHETFIANREFTISTANKVNQLQQQQQTDEFKKVYPLIPFNSRHNFTHMNFKKDNNELIPCDTFKIIPLILSHLVKLDMNCSEIVPIDINNRINKFNAFLPETHFYISCEVQAKHYRNGDHAILITTLIFIFHDCAPWCMCARETGEICTIDVNNISISVSSDIKSLPLNKDNSDIIVPMKNLNLGEEEEKDHINYLNIGDSMEHDH